MTFLVLSLDQLYLLILLHLLLLVFFDHLRLGLNVSTPTLDDTFSFFFIYPNY